MNIEKTYALIRPIITSILDKEQELSDVAPVADAVTTAVIGVLIDAETDNAA